MLRLFVVAGFSLLALVAAGRPLEFKVSDAQGQPLADAVVSLTALDALVKPPPSTATVEIVQQGQEFSPFVTAVVAGTTVVFPNRDTVQHHIYSLSKPKKFELPLYQPGKAEHVVFEQPGVVVLGCNIHDWMSAYVVVLATPWFARTPVSGAALIDHVPPGRYRVEVWHPRLGNTVTQEITVGETTPATPLAFTLTLKPDRRIRRKPEAAGGGYK